MLTQLPGSKWSYEKAAHLLNRLGFGATPPQIEAAHGLGLEGVLREMIDAPIDADRVVAPEWAQPTNIQAMRMELKALPEGSPERKNHMREIQEKQAAQILDLRRWWLNRMLTA